MEQKVREMIRQEMEKGEGKDKARYQTLKNILETAQKIAKEAQCDVTDVDIVKASRKEIKQLEDTLSFVKDKEDRKEQAESIRYSIEVAKSLLPKEATEEEIRNFLSGIHITSIGEAMKALRIKFGSAFDGKVAAEIAKEIMAK